MHQAISHWSVSFLFEAYTSQMWQPPSLEPLTTFEQELGVQLSGKLATLVSGVLGGTLANIF